MVKNSFFLLVASSLLLADDTGKQSRSYVVNNFKTAIANPMTSDKEFVTIDGKKKFKQNLTCDNSSNSFLEISYSGTSDINVNVLLDKDLNGTKESSFSFAGISGVGANGVIKCSANAWTNCKYYSFSYNGSSLFLQEVTRNDIGGAYCINSSCGSLSVSQKTEILNALGGSISNVLSSYHSNYLVTKTLNNGVKVEYFGQNYNNCTNMSNNYNTKNIPYNEKSGDNVIRQKLDTSKNDSVVYSYVLDNTERQTQSAELKKTDFASFKDMKKNLTNTLTLNNDLSFTYSTASGSGTGNLKGLDLVGIKYCQVTKATVAGTVYSDGSNKSTTSNQTTYQDSIIECVGDSYNICPVVAGESIKYDCGQINNFGEVTSVLSSVSEMANDMACSTN